MQKKKKKCAETTKEDSQSRHVLSRFVICFGQSVLCYCCILPICIGPDLLCQFPTWLTRARSRTRGLFHATVLQLPNLWPLSAEAASARGFLSIVLAASTARGLIPWTNQTIWSPQSYHVLRRKRTGMLFRLCRPGLTFICLFIYLAFFFLFFFSPPTHAAGSSHCHTLKIKTPELCAQHLAFTSQLCSK